MAHLPAMDTIATLKSLSPKRRRKKDAQVIVDAPPQELRVGDVVFLGVMARTVTWRPMH